MWAQTPLINSIKFDHSTNFPRGLISNRRQLMPNRRESISNWRELICNGKGLISNRRELIFNRRELICNTRGESKIYRVEFRCHNFGANFWCAIFSLFILDLHRCYVRLCFCSLVACQRICLTTIGSETDLFLYSDHPQ